MYKDSFGYTRSALTGTDNTRDSYTYGNTVWKDKLTALAKEFKAGLSRADANTLVNWAKEYGINNHGPDMHINRSGIWSYTEHIKIFNLHIPIFPD